MTIPEQAVEAAAERAYLNNRAGETPWADISAHHKQAWRFKVKSVLEAALPLMGVQRPEDVAREPMKIALTVLCAARAGQSWHENMLKDFDCAIYGLRVALESAALASPRETDAECERRLLDEEAAENLRLIDWIADKIGLPKNEELSRENFAQWLSAQSRASPRAEGDICIDCDGAGRYPTGVACKSCEGTGRVLPGDGIPAPPAIVAEEQTK